MDKYNRCQNNPPAEAIADLLNAQDMVGANQKMLEEANRIWSWTPPAGKSLVEYNAGLFYKLLKDVKCNAPNHIDISMKTRIDPAFKLK